MAARVVVICALLLSAWPAYGQQSVNLQFSDGRVSLRAQNATVRAILAEWARLGGATIVNGDRVAGAPVTLELANVPESQALDIVLRTVAGYMLGPRRAGTVGASAYDRIMILPTSVAPRNPPPPTPAAASARPVLPRPLMPRPQPDGVPADVAAVDDAGNQPVMPPPFPGAVPQPLIRGPVPVGADAQEADEAADDQPGITVVGSPTNPFGIPAGASARPGVISPAPRQPQTQPAQPNRVQ
jgi:hypothetical protein